MGSGIVRDIYSGLRRGYSNRGSAPQVGCVAHRPCYSFPFDLLGADAVWVGALDNGWDNWLATRLSEWVTRHAEGQPPRAAIVPDDPLYLGGVYARLRKTD